MIERRLRVSQIRCKGMAFERTDPVVCRGDLEIEAGIRRSVLCELVEILYYGVNRQCAKSGGTRQPSQFIVQPEQYRVRQSPDELEPVFGSAGLIGSGGDSRYQTRE